MCREITAVGSENQNSTTDKVSWQIILTLVRVSFIILYNNHKINKK